MRIRRPLLDVSFAELQALSPEGMSDAERDQYVADVEERRRYITREL